MEHHYTKSLSHDDIKFYPPPPIDHRSMKHHYTKSLGHDDMKFYPPPPTCMQMHFPVTVNITFFIIIIITCGTKPKHSPTTPVQYYLLENADMPRYSGQINPPQWNLVLQSSTTSGQFDM